MNEEWIESGGIFVGLAEKISRAVWNKPKKKKKKRERERERERTFLMYQSVLCLYFYH